MGTGRSWSLARIGADSIQLGHLPDRDRIAVEFDLNAENEVDGRAQVEKAIEAGTHLASLGGGAWETIGAGPC
jgi:hypothetical protein